MSDFDAVTGQKSLASSIMPLDLAIKVDKVCNRFESSWKEAASGGEPPSIEDFIHEGDVGIHLLHELIAVDVYYRRLRGEQPQPEDYNHFDGFDLEWFEDQIPNEAKSTRDPESTAPSSDASEPIVPGCMLPGDRYRVVDEIARGGMGVVYRVQDTDLHRSLALKVMRAEVGQLGRARFLSEAQITGQLQHPGIPPIHEIGALADERPFFSMKLVEGRTLADLLRERDEPASDLPRYLTVFSQIAQTVAFAHSQGLIHRDLKPLNIMVGEFGEVQVMDWGLARRVTAIQEDVGAVPPEKSPSTTLAGDTVANSQYDEFPERLTSPGQVLGTLAYMPPEQANGLTQQLDKQSDVFGLGAIFCEILTGLPPYAAGDRKLQLQLAQAADLSDALNRLHACGAEPELVALAEECLAKDPSHRPVDAATVANRVDAHLASLQERLKQAEIARATALTKATEERKRRTTTLSLAVTLLGLIVIGSLFAVFVTRNRTQHQLRVSKVADTLQRYRQVRESRHWPKADFVLKEAESAMIGMENTQVGVEVQAARREVDVARGSEAILLKAMAKEALRDEDPRKYFRETDESFRAFFAKVGIDLQDAGVDGAIELLQHEPEPIRLELAATLDCWAYALIGSGEYEAWRESLQEIAAAAVPTALRKRLRNAQRAGDVDLLREALSIIDMDSESGQSVILCARTMRIAGLDDEARGLLSQLHIRVPDDFLITIGLADELAESDPAEALRYYTAARALRPDAASVLVNLGNVLQRLVRHSEAIAYYEEAIRPGAADNNNDLAIGYYNLGVALKTQDELGAAITQFERALDLNPNMAAAYHGLGNALYDQNEPGRAIDTLRKAVELDPEFPQAQASLGGVLRSQCRFVEATEHLGTALELDSSLVQQGFRLQAARAAARAAQGDDDREHLTYDELCAFRDRAFQFLNAELRFLQPHLKTLASRPTVLAHLKQWLNESDFASVRDPNALSELTQDEQAKWKAFWDSVRMLTDEYGHDE